ncbi:MAG: ABC transporter permease [Anaerolineae bacterium]|nr:ABC transporter permease [Anaerolineae bacterium]
MPEMIKKSIHKSSRLGSIVSSRLASFTPLLTLLALVVLFSFTSEKFLSWNNMANIAGQISVLCIVASGMTLVVLMGEIDLSVANIAMMTGIIMAMLYNSAISIFAGHLVISILAALLAALGIGIVAGFSVARLGIPSFAVTLATMQISRGITMTVTEGRPIYELPDSLRAIGSFRIGPLPGLFVIAISVLVLFYLVLKYTHYGRYIYAVGGNRAAAKMVGIRTRLMTASVMAISGLMAGIGGVLTVARLGSAQTFGSEDILIDSLAAVVIGGTALSGGVGGIANTVLGVLILGVLNNGLNQMSSNIFLKYLFKGLILLAALVINIFTGWVKERAQMRQTGQTCEDLDSETSPNLS